jgi:hypothetical protein
MTTSATAGVAPETPVNTLVDTTQPLPKVYIVGFAPSWVDTPWDEQGSHYWGMNALHKLAPNQNWSAWFQLHDVKEHHPHDLDEHVEWLGSQNFPVYMWEEHILEYSDRIPNAVPYPRQQILDKYGQYFTNTVSWMIALAIEVHFETIAVYGVDMAQDSEYQNQRPSCEYFLGWAKGAGIDLEIPKTSDLLKSPYLYGYQDGSVMTAKYRARLKELTERRAELERQRNAAHEGLLQVMGAAEDTSYWLRVWTQEETKTNG